MKIRIIRPNATVFKQTVEIKGKHTKLPHTYYCELDTIEIELNELIRYMQDHYVDPQNIEFEREVVNIVEDFLGYKLGA